MVALELHLTSRELGFLMPVAVAAVMLIMLVQEVQAVLAAVETVGALLLQVGLQILAVAVAAQETAIQVEQVAPVS
jgi:hypothetical protein